MYDDNRHNSQFYDYLPGNVYYSPDDSYSNNRDTDPAYSHEISNFYHKNQPWNQPNNGNFVANVFKLVGVLIVAFFIFSSMVK